MTRDDFFIEKKIYYHDTDCGGVVYYANYLKYLEEGRNEFCAKIGIDLKELADSGIYFVVRRVEIDYLASAHYHDKLRIYSKLSKVGNASLVFIQDVKRDDTQLVQAVVTLVCVSKDLKPLGLPEDIKKIFAAAGQ